MFKKKTGFQPTCFFLKRRKKKNLFCFSKKRSLQCDEKQPSHFAKEKNRMNKKLPNKRKNKGDKKMPDKTSYKRK